LPSALPRAVYVRCGGLRLFASSFALG
jgi:hypothetical protein